MGKRKWPSNDTCDKCRFWEDTNDTCLGEIDGAYHPFGVCHHEYVTQMTCGLGLKTYCDFGCIFFEKPLVPESPEWWASKVLPNGI